MISTNVWKILQKSRSSHLAVEFNNFENQVLSVHVLSLWHLMQYWQGFGLGRDFHTRRGQSWLESVRREAYHTRRGQRSPASRVWARPQIQLGRRRHAESNATRHTTRWVWLDAGPFGLVAPPWMVILIYIVVIVVPGWLINICKCRRRRRRRPVDSWPGVWSRSANNGVLLAVQQWSSQAIIAPASICAGIRAIKVSAWNRRDCRDRFRVHQVSAGYRPRIVKEMCYFYNFMTLIDIPWSCNCETSPYSSTLIFSPECYPFTPVIAAQIINTLSGLGSCFSPRLKILLEPRITNQKISNPFLALIRWGHAMLVRRGSVLTCITATWKPLKPIKTLHYSRSYARFCRRHCRPLGMLEFGFRAKTSSSSSSFPGKSKTTYRSADVLRR